jgi:uncharacterized MAPEG superfamily protein
MKRHTDGHRNFLENLAPFTALSLGIAVLVAKPSCRAVVALKAFTISRIVHSLMFVWFPYQPYRALVFVPQALAQVVLMLELWSNRA